MSLLDLPADIRAIIYDLLERSSADLVNTGTVHTIPRPGASLTRVTYAHVTQPTSGLTNLTQVSQNYRADILSLHFSRQLLVVRCWATTKLKTREWLDIFGEIRIPVTDHIRIEACTCVCELRSQGQELSVNVSPSVESRNPDLCSSYWENLRSNVQKDCAAIVRYGWRQRSDGTPYLTRPTIETVAQYLEISEYETQRLSWMIDGPSRHLDSRLG